MVIITRRKILGGLAAVSLLHPPVACGKENFFMDKGVTLDVVLFNYQNIAIFDVLLSGGDIGVANVYGGGGIMTGVTISLGPQTLTWRDGASGKTFSVKNSLNLTKDQIPPKAEYLAVHIYPDGTAELAVSQYIPEITSRGRKILDEVRKNGR